MTKKDGHTYMEFKIGRDRFSAEAFHPLRYERGVYAVNIYQIGKPLVDKYMYFTQVRAKNGSDAIIKVKDEFEKMHRRKVMV